MNKQQIERKISELNVRYSQEKLRLKNKLFVLKQLEREKQSHTMKYGVEFYINIFKYLLKLDKTYCDKGNGEYSCKGCKFKTKNHTCIRNWLISEFDEFVRQAKKGD